MRSRWLVAAAPSLLWVLVSAPATVSAQEPGVEASEVPASPEADAPAADPVGKPLPAPPSVPTPAPAAQPDPEAVQADALGPVISSGLAIEDPTAPERKLDLYGFADFTVFKPMLSDDNRWRGFINPNTVMGVGNLNVYLASQLSERVRSLVEFRLLYLPNGAQTIGPDGTISVYNTSVEDPFELHRQMNWGGVSIERAWVEFEAHELLIIRAGQFLTPYGIWNVDHGSPTVIGARRPFTVTEALFPERQSGLELHGQAAIGDLNAGYHLTISNGRGRATEYNDEDNNKAVGGRVFLTTRRLGELTLGSSFYHGRQSQYDRRWTVDPVTKVRVQQATATRDLTETAVAFDLKWLWRSLHLQAEFVTREQIYKDAARPRGETPYRSYFPDNRRWGSYALLGYRTSLWGLMPYAMFEAARFATGDSREVRAVYAGINFRPDPAVVLKAEYLLAWFPNALPYSWGQDNISGLTFQVAWVF